MTIQDEIFKENLEKFKKLRMLRKSLEERLKRCDEDSDYAYQCGDKLIVGWKRHLRKCIRDRNAVEIDMINNRRNTPAEEMFNRLVGKNV